MSMLKKTIFFVILVSLVSLTTLHLKGYCDEWVYVESYKNFTQYYNSSSVKIDKQNKIIKLWEKRVYTEKGKIDFFGTCDSNEKLKYTDIDHTLGLVLLDYKNWKYSINHIKYYAKSNNVVFDGERPTKWRDITPDSKDESCFNKILKDYNIHR